MISSGVRPSLTSRKFCLSTVGFEPATVEMSARRSSNGPDRVAQLEERRASISKVAISTSYIIIYIYYIYIFL